MTEEVIRDVCEKYFCKYEKNCEMSRHTTFKTGGAADFAVYPDSIESLKGICVALDSLKVKYMVVGNGSNLLFPDEGFRGVAVITTTMKNAEVVGNTIKADCGASLIKLSVMARDNSLKGFEFAYGIPGSVGGAVYMNAGAYGSEISDILKSCRVYDRESGEILSFCNSECDFSYRNSIFEKGKNRYIILDAEFELEEGNTDEIGVLMEDYMSRRRDKQPLEYPSAGSAFKRTEGYFTAKLIDDAGLKGYTIGGAQVSEKHAGFIINKGNATANDVKSLMKHIKDTVKEKFGVDIEGEIRIVE